MIWSSSPNKYILLKKFFSLQFWLTQVFVFWGPPSRFASWQMFSKGKFAKNKFYPIKVHRSRLGKGAENQNGNLRWHLPWKGGGLEGVSSATYLFWKMIFLKKPFRIIPWLWKRVLHLVWALYYVYIVVEMTLNMAK